MRDWIPVAVIIVLLLLLACYLFTIQPGTLFTGVYHARYYL